MRNKVINKIIKNTLFLSAFFLITKTLVAQCDNYPEVCPDLPFELKKATTVDYQKCTVWKGVYGLGAGDLSGEMWSNTIENPYQYQKYAFGDGKMDLITSYLPKGKDWSIEFFYQQNLLSAIEKLDYDSLQNPKIGYSYTYMYKHDKTPSQRVKKFDEMNKGIRLLEEFEFDNLNRMVRQKATAFGYSRQMDSLLGLQDQEKMLTLSEYGDSTFTRRVYKNLHDIVKDEKSYYDDNGLFYKTELRNPHGVLTTIIDYEYEGGQLIKKTYWKIPQSELIITPKEEASNKKKSKNKKEILIEKVIEVVEPELTRVDRVEYFFYNEENFVEKHIIEENEIQFIFEYTFFRA